MDAFTPEHEKGREDKDERGDDVRDGDAINPDVERERQMVAAGVPIEEFEGYEPERQAVRSKKRPEAEPLDHYDEPSSQRSRISQMVPDDEYDYELYEEPHTSQRDRISQMVPDEDTGYREHHEPQRSRISQMVPQDEFDELEAYDEIEDFESIRKKENRHRDQRRRIRQFENDDF